MREKKFQETQLIGYTSDNLKAQRGSTFGKERNIDKNGKQVQKGDSAQITGQEEVMQTSGNEFNDAVEQMMNTQDGNAIATMFM